MATLYELTQQALVVQEMLMSGDIDEDTFNDTIESLDIDTKVENICKVIRNLDADAKMYKEEKDRLAAKQKTAENGVERLKKLLLFHLKSTNKPSIESGLFKVSKGCSKTVIVEDVKAIPVEFREPQPDKINKAEIKKLLLAGESVTGAELQENEYVTIR